MAGVFPSYRIRENEGTMLYSAMLGHFDDQQHPGVLIIVRLIEIAARLPAGSTSMLSSTATADGTGYAIEYHTENKSVAETELKTTLSLSSP